ncbi:uncharacterized protein LOC107047460 [Diachasma alloeum]|uniref:uncharacterized protein LOC107047460 n=1 Tax=Diachasma alloeum TaxID=454923 RepID=UPI0007381369|nr:uncharacterized protein LOC107047460 [Diachasma alloeum]
MNAVTPKSLKRKLNETEDKSEQAGEKTHCVVEYLEEGNTHTVPLNWTEDYEGQTFGYWPNKYKNAELRAAIRSCEKPDVNKWDSHLIKIHYRGTLADCHKREKALLDHGSSFVSEATENLEAMESTGAAHKSSKKSSALTGEQRSKDLVNELYKEGHAADVHDQSLLAPSTSGQSVRLRKKLIEPKDSVPQKRDNEPDDELRELEPGLTPKKKCRICSNFCLDCAAKEEANELYQRKVLRLLRRILG